VPYKGPAPAILDASTGQVSMTVAYLVAVEKRYIEPSTSNPAS